MQKQRLQQMIEDLHNLGSISTEEAVKRYEASPATIRRDFTELAQKGLAARTHGGIIMPQSDSGQSIPLGLRQKWNSAEKKALAQAAIEYIGTAASVLVHGGSTTAHLGYYWRAGLMVSDMPEIGMLLRERFPDGGDTQFILTGGEFDWRTGNLRGAAFRRSLDNYWCDFGVTSVHSLDANGLYEIEEEYAEQNALLLAHTARRMVIIDHSKLQRKAFFRAFTWEQVQILVVPANCAEHETVRSARAQGVEIVTAAIPE